MTLLSLFSGIGAFERALELLNIPVDLIGFSEIDKYAEKAYRLLHNVSSEKSLGDVTGINADDITCDLDLLTYGFPCQDISLAGRMKGLIEGTRSGLFWTAADIIAKTQPKIAIAENVKNLTSKRFESQFDMVLQELKNIGYVNYWTILQAAQHGIPQNRERVFIVSIRQDLNDTFVFPTQKPLTIKLKDLLEDEVDDKYILSAKMLDSLIYNNDKQTNRGNGFRFSLTDPCKIAKSITTKAGSRMTDNFIRVIGVADIKGYESIKRVYDTEFCAPTIVTGTSGNSIPKIPIRTATKKGYEYASAGDGLDIAYVNQNKRRGRVQTEKSHTLTCTPTEAVYDYPKIRKLTPVECFRLMGFEKKDVDLLRKHGISDTQLYKMAGNSIVVNVLVDIFKQLTLYYPEIFMKHMIEEVI